VLYLIHQREKGEKKMNTKYVGLGVCDVLGIVFIVLKLIGVISWSWWWVLAPFWIPLAIVILCAIIVAIFDR
jgi:membrane protein YdbS with pleckstrin-like domain